MEVILEDSLVDVEQEIDQPLPSVLRIQLNFSKVALPMAFTRSDKLQRKILLEHLKEVALEGRVKLEAFVEEFVFRVCVCLGSYRGDWHSLGL
jgi:hypothetical protein